MLISTSHLMKAGLKVFFVKWWRETMNARSANWKRKNRNTDHARGLNCFPSSNLKWVKRENDLEKPQEGQSAPVCCLTRQSMGWELG